MTDQDILAIAGRVYESFVGQEYPRVDRAWLAFGREIEKHLGHETQSLQLQAEAWRSLVQWISTAPDSADSQARQLYAMDLINGTAFEDWYDYGAGRADGTNAPPPEVLMVLRPYLLGKMTSGDSRPMSRTRKTELTILVGALYELARTIQSDDGVANSAIFEAAERLDWQALEIDRLTGDRKVLVDLLRDVLPIVETVSDDDGEDWMMAMALGAKIKSAIDGTDRYLLAVRP